MKTGKIVFGICVLMLCVILESCRKEELVLIEAPEEEVLAANSNIASLIQKTVSNDGSDDNILDKSNCFNIKFPVSVMANGNAVNVTSKSDYKIVEYIFDDTDDDIDVLNIVYPIIIVLEDYSEVIINNKSELNNHSNRCNDENEYDDDIECVDFQYPIIASTFNKNNELITKDTFSSDIELNEFLKNLNEDKIVTIDFPIDVMLKDGTLVNVANMPQLENTINDHKDDCDEDDDYNYNDDDCDDCTIEELTSIITDCGGWTVDKLNRDNTNHDSVYDGYKFHFSENGSLRVYWAGQNEYGTWVTSGTKNNITVTIDLPDLPLCNNNWRLHEISKYSKTRVDLRVTTKDRLRYNNVCN